MIFIKFLIRALQWIIIILFSFVWGVGGYIEHPFLANLSGIVIIHFWLLVICFSLYKLIQLVKIKIVE